MLETEISVEMSELLEIEKELNDKFQSWAAKKKVLVFDLGELVIEKNAQGKNTEKEKEKIAAIINQISNKKNKLNRDLGKLRRIKARLKFAKKRELMKVRRELVYRLCNIGIFVEMAGFGDMDPVTLLGMLLWAKEMSISDSTILNNWNEQGEAVFNPELFYLDGNELVLREFIFNGSSREAKDARHRRQRQLCNLGSVVEQAGFGGCEFSTLLGMLLWVKERSASDSTYLSIWKERGEAALRAETCFIDDNIDDTQGEVAKQPCRTIVSGLVGLLKVFFSRMPALKKRGGSRWRKIS
jgi:hypothetical protein